MTPIVPSPRRFTAHTMTPDGAVVEVAAPRSAYDSPVLSARRTRPRASSATVASPSSSVPSPRTIAWLQSELGFEQSLRAAAQRQPPGPVIVCTSPTLTESADGGATGRTSASLPDYPAGPASAEVLHAMREHLQAMTSTLADERKRAAHTWTKVNATLSDLRKKNAGHLEEMAALKRKLAATEKLERNQALAVEDAMSVRNKLAKQVHEMRLREEEAAAAAAAREQVARLARMEEEEAAAAAAAEAGGGDADSEVVSPLSDEHMIPLSAAEELVQQVREESERATVLERQLEATVAELTRVRDALDRARGEAAEAHGAYEAKLNRVTELYNRVAETNAQLARRCATTGDRSSGGSSSSSSSRPRPSSPVATPSPRRF